MIDDIFGGEELPNEEIYRAAQGVVRRVMEKEGKKIEWVAAQLGTTKGYLYASLDPHQTHKPLSVDRTVAITELSGGDMAIVETMAKRFGYVLVKADTKCADEADAIGVAVKTLELEQLHGILAKVVKESVEDGKLDSEEVKKIVDAIYPIRKLAAQMEAGLK